LSTGFIFQYINHFQNRKKGYFSTFIQVQTNEWKRNKSNKADNYRDIKVTNLVDMKNKRNKAERVERTVGV